MSRKPVQPRSSTISGMEAPSASYTIRSSSDMSLKRLSDACSRLQMELFPHLRQRNRIHHPPRPHPADTSPIPVGCSPAVLAQRRAGASDGSKPMHRPVYTHPAAIPSPSRLDALTALRPSCPLPWRDPPSPTNDHQVQLVARRHPRLYATRRRGASAHRLLARHCWHHGMPPQANVAGRALRRCRCVPRPPRCQPHPNIWPLNPPCRFHHHHRPHGRRARPHRVLTVISLKAAYTRVSRWLFPVPRAACAASPTTILELGRP
jgi:hypothetical protein